MMRRRKISENQKDPKRFPTLGEEQEREDDNIGQVQYNSVEVTLSVVEFLCHVGSFVCFLLDILLEGDNWGGFFMIPFIFQLGATIYWYDAFTEPFDCLDVIPFLQCIKFRSKRGRAMRYLSFWRYFCLSIYLLLLILPYRIYIDRFGGYWGGDILSYEGMSSCNNMPFFHQEGGSYCVPIHPPVTQGTFVYNANGALGSKPYTTNGIYAFYYMDQTWAPPPNVTAGERREVTGYGAGAGGSAECSVEGSPGVISFRGCWGSYSGVNENQGVCNNAFPDLTYGVVVDALTGVDFLTTFNTTEGVADNCPGNRGGTDISRGVVAKALPLCPYCLWYWKVNVAGGVGQPAQTPLDEQCFQGASPFDINGNVVEKPLGWLGGGTNEWVCTFGPARGVDGGRGIFASKKFSKDAVQNQLIFLATGGLFIPAFHFIMTWLLSLIRQKGDSDRVFDSSSSSSDGDESESEEEESDNKEEEERKGEKNV